MKALMLLFLYCSPLFGANPVPRSDSEVEHLISRVNLSNDISAMMLLGDTLFFTKGAIYQRMVGLLKREVKRRSVGYGRLYSAQAALTLAKLGESGQELEDDILEGLNAGVKTGSKIFAAKGEAWMAKNAAVNYMEALVKVAGTTDARSERIVETLLRLIDVTSEPVPLLAAETLTDLAEKNSSLIVTVDKMQRRDWLLQHVADLIEFYRVKRDFFAAKSNRNSTQSAAKHENWRARAVAVEAAIHSWTIDGQTRLPRHLAHVRSNQSEFSIGHSFVTTCGSNVAETHWVGSDLGPVDGYAD